MKLFRYLKPFRLSISAALVLVMIRALADLYLPTLSADMVNVGIVNGDIQYIWHVGIRMMVFAAAGTSAFIFSGYLSSRAAAGFARLLREQVFSRVESFSLYEFNRFGTASLINRTTNDITHLQNVLIFGMRMMVMAPMLSIGSLFLAFSKEPVLARAFLAVIPVLFAIISITIRKGVPLFQAMQVKLDDLNRIVRERLTGIRVIRAFNRDDYEKQRFQDTNSDYTATAVRVNRIMGAMMPLMTLVMNLTIVGIVWFAGIRIDLGFTNVGNLMAFIQYAMHIMFSFVAISRIFVVIPRATASAARINEILDTAVEIRDPEKAKKTEGKGGSVEFREVTFSYPGAERPTLSNISFIARPGKVTGIIGSTGSGKSTLAGLILRFYDVDSGSILVDGVDVREMTQESLRSKIGFVPQNAVLFSGSVLENIRFGREDADEKDIMRAAETAQAAGFILDMKEGFSSMIAQGGRNLSGGQKQRISIARAIIRKAGIYILDDCFSALDYRTEARLRSALFKETGDSTVIIISQRVSTVKEADQIIVLEEGKIAGIGTHEELLDDCAIYREIVSSQFSEEGIA